MDNPAIVTHNHDSAGHAVIVDGLVDGRIDSLGTRKRLRGQSAGSESEAKKKLHPTLMIAVHGVPVWRSLVSKGAANLIGNGAEQFQIFGAVLQSLFMNRLVLPHVENRSGVESRKHRGIVVAANG